MAFVRCYLRSGCHGHVIITPALYSGGHVLKRPAALRFFVDFLIPCRLFSGSTLNYAVSAPYIFFLVNHPLIIVSFESALASAVDGGRKQAIIDCRSRDIIPFPLQVGRGLSLGSHWGFRPLAWSQLRMCCIGSRG